MTIHERLLKLSKDDLFKLLLLFASEADEAHLRDPMTKAKLATKIEEGMRKSLPLLRLVLGYMGVCLVRDLIIDKHVEAFPIDLPDEIEDLFDHLREFGLANRTRSRWELDPLLAEICREVDSDEMEELKYRQGDVLFLDSLLMRYGMLTSDQLITFAEQLTGSDYDMEYVWQLMVTAHGMKCIWYPQDNTDLTQCFFVCPMLENPEALLDRLHLPFIESLPYAAPDPEDLNPVKIVSNPKHFKDLLAWYKKKGEDEDAAMERISNAALLLQEHPGSHCALPLIEGMDLDEKDLLNDTFLNLVSQALDNVPLWYNKGLSAADLVKCSYKPGQWQSPKKGNRAARRKNSGSSHKNNFS